MCLGVPSGERRGELGHLDDGLDGLGKQAVGHALLEGAGVAGRGQGRVNGQLAQGHQVKVVGGLLQAAGTVGEEMCIRDRPASALVEETAAKATLSAVDVPESIRGNMALFLRLVRKVLEESDPEMRATFDVLLDDAIKASYDDDGATEEATEAFADLERVINGLDEAHATMLMRAFVAYFHLSLIHI